MEGGLRLQSRRAFLQHVIPQYREASTVKKQSKRPSAQYTCGSTSQANMGRDLWRNPLWEMDGIA
jgi:hypothetical protein